jgi:DNA-binding response OmpR family regulator
VIVGDDDDRGALRVELVEQGQDGRSVRGIQVAGRFIGQHDRRAALLPDIDGFEIVRRLRQDGFKVPVIFLTARDTMADKVAGLTIGGDDYLTKPFGLEELAARIRTVLRRTRGAHSERVLTFADLDLDQDSYEVRRGGRLIDLSPTEYRLLRYLMLNPGRVLTRAQRLDHVWDYGFGGPTASCPPTSPTCGAN